MGKKVTCIVAAGGSGKRMGADINKLFLEINDVPVIAYTLLVLENCELIDKIIISAREEDIMFLSKIVEEFEILKVTTIVRGGATRGESVLCASREVSEDTDFVMVHDGARPLVTSEIIEKTLASAISFGAAACGVKPKCTLKTVDADVITGTADREKTVEIQTPQIFDKRLFDEMYNFDIETIKNATDDCILAEKTGASVHITEGSYKNIKITTPEDIEIAEIFLRRY